MSPLKPFAVLSQLQPTEEIMSGLTSVVTMTTGDVLAPATSEIPSGSKLGIDALFGNAV